MARRRRSSLDLSGQQAQAALALLIQEGKLRAGEVQKAIELFFELAGENRIGIKILNPSK